jgi:hypothetical protein
MESQGHEKVTVPFSVPFLRLKRAISNRREIQMLLTEWEEETASEILNPSKGDDQK